MRLERSLLVAAAGAVVALVATASASAQDSAGGVSAVQVANEGKLVYEQICQACHMADAKGGGGAGAAIPALANNPKLKDKDYPITLLLKGRGGMPWFTDMLTPEQMAAVATYIRSHFNNYPDPVTVEDVKRVGAGNPGSAPDCTTCN
ncbi:MAG: c-type cytochrome [Pseudomonadota bacterium]|uniref:c-type cytochrome n=1 Tax=Rhizorhabdus phycosphaerae TaxID=2711156 RepID=UPI0013EC01F3|nr:cytochrome c [Rhizorhabdus phycosphaerae]